jgi:flagellar hook-length control protein FliK
MDPILAALLNAPSPSANSAQPPSPSSSDASSAAQFKSQFDQAVAALTNAAGSTQGSAATTSAAQATTAGSTVQTAAVADTLQASLQKKIADLLQKGESVSEIVQQLAASLASQLAQQFGGDPAQIQNQLQTAIASALTLPSTTGPPLSTTDLASALAQRFRQVADVAAGVLGETGQSNRLFAGSNSDAATTAGVQPAPTTTTTTSADSIASDASALLASLTASQGDGKTVATNGAPALGPNGDTLLGRILTRAAQSSQANDSQAQAGTSPAQSGPPGLTVIALAAAAAALGNGAAQPTPSVSSAASTAAALRALAETANTSSANSGSTPTVLATQQPAPLNPAVAAFVKAFTDALATTTASVTAKTTAGESDPGALLQTTVSSSQAPTIGAFAPVQAGLPSDALSSNGTQPAPATPSQTGVDPNLVVEQVLRGAFLNTSGSVSTVRMRLVPEELGDISVKLTIEGSSVSAQVMAQTPAAHDALVAGQAQLTRALADNGLKLTSFNVDLAGGFASFQQQQQQQQSSQQGTSNGRNLLLGGVDTTETDDTSLTATPNFGPPVLAGASWSALNYLV